MKALPLILSFRLIIALKEKIRWERHLRYGNTFPFGSFYTSNKLIMRFIYITIHRILKKMDNRYNINFITVFYNLFLLRIKKN